MSRARIGVTAGASAPEILVERVIGQLRDWGAEAVVEQDGIREQVVFALPRELSQAQE
jgi:4-hydroxy-3-methylbut-2-en-1-yl diphosphate reductase